MSAPHATTTPNRCAPRAPDMSDRNGGRPASRVEPRIAVAIQSAWCPPPRTWRARPTGVLVIDCFSRALSTGCAPDGCDRDRGQRWLGVAVVDVRARALLPSRLYHYSGTHCSSWQLDAIPQERDCAQRLGCSRLSTMSRRRWSTLKRASGGVHFSADPRHRAVNHSLPAARVVFSADYQDQICAMNGVTSYTSAGRSGSSAWCTIAPRSTCTYPRGAESPP